MEKERYFDTIIGVIDPSTGQLLKSMRLDKILSGYLNGGDGLFTTRREDASGMQYVDVWRLVLSNPSLRGGR